MVEKLCVLSKVSLQIEIVIKPKVLHKNIKPNIKYIFRSSIFGAITHSLIDIVIALLSIYLLFVDRFGRSLRICHLQFDKKAIYDG